MATAVITAVCVWTSFTTNTAPPPNAFAAGFYHMGGTRGTSPLYVVRINGTGQVPAFGWQRTRHSVIVHGVRGFDDIHYEDNVLAEILTCKGLDKVTMRWVQYNSMVDMERCVQLGRNNNGEKIYLARILIEDHPPAKTYLPATFVPSSGLAITEHYGTYATDCFMVFCGIIS